MVSFTTKFSMFTMFSTMALGRNLNAVDDLGASLDARLSAIQQSILDFGIKQVDQNDLLKALETSMDSLEDQQITGDYFKINGEEMTVGDDDVLLHSFIVKAGESLDFLANITTHDDYQSNFFKLYLLKNGAVVARSEDDGNWVDGKTAENDDNLSLSLLYKGQFDQDARYEVFAQALPFEHKIKEDQMQISYKTYGVGHKLTVF